MRFLFHKVCLITLTTDRNYAHWSPCEHRLPGIIDTRIVGTFLFRQLFCTCMVLMGTRTLCTAKQMLSPCT